MFGGCSKSATAGGIPYLRPTDPRMSGRRRSAAGGSRESVSGTVKSVRAANMEPTLGPLVSGGLEGSNSFRFGEHLEAIGVSDDGKMAQGPEARMQMVGMGDSGGRARRQPFSEASAGGRPTRTELASVSTWPGAVILGSIAGVVVSGPPIGRRGSMADEPHRVLPSCPAGAFLVRKPG